MDFQPDYRHFMDVMQNKRPARLPLYEHYIDAQIMEKVLDAKFAELHNGNASEIGEYFRQHCRFFKEMTYDTVSYEIGIYSILPGNMAIFGGQGPIQNRADFEAYPWKELPALYWKKAQPRLDALVAALPSGMKAVGGVGNGLFELAESLVGLEYLPYIEVDDPELYTDLYTAIGSLMCSVWSEFMPRYGKYFAACRFGDDLGFKSSLLTNPKTVRNHIFPQYRRVIDIVHEAGCPFLWHSCGCIFDIMDDAIALGINAKHSNEDTIAPYDRWIKDYGSRIGLMGGFDMDALCVNTPEVVYERVLEDGRRFRKTAQGYALGSGNSIADYVPVANYLAMVKAAQALRQEESM